MRGRSKWAGCPRKLKLPLLRGLSWVLGMATLAFGGLASRPAQAVAQTGAIKAYLPNDLSTYRTVEECLSAIDRVWQDFDPTGTRKNGGNRWSLVPDSVRTAAARCGQGQLKLEDLAAGPYPLGTLLEFLLLGRRDADAQTLLARRETGIPATDTARLRQVEDTVLRAYEAAVRGPEYQALLEVRLRRTVNTLVEERLQLHGALEAYAESMGDTAAAVAHATQIVAEGEAAHDASLATYVADALMRLHLRETLDSLAQGTESVNRLLLSFWKRGGGSENNFLTAVRPTPTPTVKADYWFGGDSGATAGQSPGQRPTPGRVSLVVVIESFGTVKGELDALGSGEMCSCGQSDREGLRQLAQRFPALEITLVARTMGHFSTGVGYRWDMGYASGVAVPDPAQEAKMLWDWLQLHRVPGVLAVIRGQLTTLPAPDRRVLHVIEPDETIYGGSPGQFLVDRTGQIIPIPGGIPDARRREYFLGMVDALLRQQPAAPPANPPVPHP